jgi:hypothetical protein
MYPTQIEFNVISHKLFSCLDDVAHEFLSEFDGRMNICTDLRNCSGSL